MKAETFGRIAMFGLLCGLLMSCVQTATPGGPSFRSQYDSARTALERGDYPRAERLYARVMPNAGPFEDRVRLEHAHVVLRAGEYERAAETAGALADTTSGVTRGAALAVQGTADHETGLQLLANGDRPSGKARLIRARDILAEVLRDHPDLDPLGSMAGRRASIEARLSALR
ncbi:MAG: hypothetical protein AAGE03_00285 [Pseudomonadota bacterium]